MPWVGPAIGAVGALGSAAISSAGASSNAGLSPFRVNNDFGSAQVNKRGVTSSSGGLGAEQGRTFNDLTTSFLGQIPGAPTGQINLDPNSILGAGTDNSVSAPWMERANTLFGQGGDVLAAFKGFNPDAFAATQFERLNRLAAPAEQTAANQTATRLFGSGRLGVNDSRSGQVFRDLDMSQAMARDARLLSAIGLAGTESDRLLSQGTTLLGAGTNQATTGETMQASTLARFLQGIQGAQGVGNYNTNYITSLLGQASQGQAGAYASGQGQRDAIATALTGAGSTSAASLASAKLGATQGQYLGDLLGTATGGIVDALSGLRQPQNIGSRVGAAINDPRNAGIF